jgi:hypothetical protein
LPAASEVQNLVDEISDLINSTLYKLKFLKWVSLSERTWASERGLFFDKKPVENPK